MVEVKMNLAKEREIYENEVLEYIYEEDLCSGTEDETGKAPLIKSGTQSIAETGGNQSNFDVDAGPLEKSQSEPSWYTAPTTEPSNSVSTSPPFSSTSTSSTTYLTRRKGDWKWIPSESSKGCYPFTTFSYSKDNVANKNTPCHHKDYPRKTSDQIISVHEIDLQPPEGYRWKGSWKMKRDKIVMLQWSKQELSKDDDYDVNDKLKLEEYDEEGWEYATSFERLKDPERPPRSKIRRSDRVRRRTFYREFVKKEKEWTVMEVEEEMKKAYLILRSDRRLLDNVKKVVGSEHDTFSVRQNFDAFTQDIKEFMGEIERGFELCGYFDYTSNAPSDSLSNTSTDKRYNNTTNIPSSMWQLKHKIESELKKLSEGIQEIQIKMDEFPLPSRLSSISDHSIERRLTDEGRRVERVQKSPRDKSHSRTGTNEKKLQTPTKKRSGKPEANPSLSLEVKSESSKAIQTWTLQNQLLKQKHARERKTSESSEHSDSSSSYETALRKSEVEANDYEPQVQVQNYTSNNYDNSYTYDQNKNEEDNQDATLAHSQQMLQSRLILQEEEDEIDVRILQEREEVSKEIFKSASRLRESMMLLAHYVNEQGELVEEVAKNVEQTHERVKTGVRHLEEAHELQKSTPCVIM